MEMTTEKQNIHLQNKKPPLKPLPTTKTTESNSANNTPNNAQLLAGKLALKQIVKALFSIGMNTDSIYSTLLQYNYIYKQVLTGMTKEDVFYTITSLLSEKKENNLSLTDEIHDYIQGTEGVFTLRDVCEMTNVGNDRTGKNKASVILGRFVQDGTIKREGKKNGVFRKVDASVVEMDFLNANEKVEDIWLPFGMEKLVTVHPGNILLFAGEPNAGKTAMLLNIVKYNQEKYKVHYFNSEMGGSELRKRLKNFDNTFIGDWKFRAIERSHDFEDAIVPGEGNLNIIDFLELYDSFYEISGKLAKIHDALDGAVCVVTLQKNTGSDWGLGGQRGMEKPRLYCSLSPGVLKIIKGKNWATDRNPNGLQIKYRLQGGCNLNTNGDWHECSPKPKGK